MVKKVLLTGSAFPQGERNIIMIIFPAGKIRRILQNAHILKGTMVCCVALQSAPLKVCSYTPRGAFFTRLASEHF
jgi:hypothetical protein